MTIYFGGGEMGAFIPSDSTISETATANGDPFNTGFARCSTYAITDANYFESPSIGSLTTGWAHFDMMVGTYPGDGQRFSWYDGSAVECIRMVVNSTGAVSMQYNIGAGWVTAGTGITTTTQSRQTIDIEVVCNSASGSIKLYLAGTKRIDSGTIDLSAITELDVIRFTGKTSVGPLSSVTYGSQVIVADEPTIGLRPKTAPPTGAGSTTNWTGTYAEVDEIVYEDADFINVASANQVHLFAHSTTVPTGYRVKAVIVTARAKCGASGPQNLQLVLKSGATTDVGSTQALDVGYGAFVEVWENDPATGSPFTVTAANAIQFGVKSIA